MTQQSEEEQVLTTATGAVVGGLAGYFIGNNVFDSTTGGQLKVMGLTLGMMIGGACLAYLANYIFHAAVSYLEAQRQANAVPPAAIPNRQGLEGDPLLSHLNLNSSYNLMGGS